MKSESISSFTEKAAKEMDKKTQVIKRIAVESVPAETSELQSDIQFIQFILADDLGEFANWWQQNVTEKKDSVSVSGQDSAGDFEKVKHVLWMLWATNGDTLDSSSIGLRSDINETDKRLRASKITIESSYKERLPNSNVVKTERLQSAKINNTHFLNNILGIKYITKNQQEAFEKESAQLVITGCPGSGKSLMLLARFLRQALTNTEPKMVLLVFNQLKFVEYKHIFEKAEISFMDVSEDEFDPDLWQSRIGVIHCSTRNDNTKKFQFLKELSQVVIYVDDAHACDFNLSLTQCTCIAVGFSQCHLARDQIGLGFWNSSMWKCFDLVTLTHNYRSSWNSVANLKSLSEVIQRKDTEQKNFAICPPELSHHPSHGHMIYGPQTIIDVMHNTIPMNKTDQLNEVFQKCLQRMSDFLSLFNKAKYFTSKVFVLDPKEDPFYTHLVQQINNLRTKIGVAVNSREQNFYSTEFAACFINVVFSDMDTKMLRYLYESQSLLLYYSGSGQKNRQSTTK